jgi:sn-glycerol 3-phosphate transport system permease protein
MQDNIRWDKWWGRLIGVFVLLFLGWFIATEWAGFRPLFDLIVGAIVSIPDAIANLVTYYGDVDFGPLIQSLLVGAGFGALLTVFIFLSRQAWLSIPSVSPTVIWLTVLTGAIALLAGVNFLLTIGLMLLTLLIAGYLLVPDVRQFFRRETLRRLHNPQALVLIRNGMIIGAFAGAIGSQIFAAPTRHCTYASDADFTSRLIGLIVTVIGSLVVLIPVWTVTLRRTQRKEQGNAGYFQGWLLPITLLVPTLLALIVFLYYPSFQIAGQSLIRARRRQEPTFQCLDNFVELANDTVYRSSFSSTILITVAIVLFSMVIALLIATLASQKVKGASVYRTLLIWPYALSPVVTAAIFIAMFRDDTSGLINYTLVEVFSAEPVSWLTDASLAPWVLILAAVYNILGFNIIFYIAGLQNVPQDLLEAAQIDGANVVQRFFRITIPLLSPYTFFLLVANITYSFYGIYGVIDTLFPGGGPLLPDGESQAANVLIYNLYEDAFRSSSQIGETAAQSVILFVLVAGITLIQFRYLESRVTYSE